MIQRSADQNNFQNPEDKPLDIDSSSIPLYDNVSSIQSSRRSRRDCFLEDKESIEFVQPSPVRTPFRNSIDANNCSLPESNGLKSHFNSENIASSSNLCSSIGSSLSNVNNSNSIDRSNKDDLSVIRSSLNLSATSGHIPRTSSEQSAWSGPTTSVECIPSIDRNQPSWSGYDNVMDLREAHRSFEKGERTAGYWKLETSENTEQL